MGAVGSGGSKNYVTSAPYNPQSSGGYKVQAPAPPQKTARVFYTSKYDPQSGEFTKVRTVKSYTDVEWQAQQVKLQIATQTQKLIEDFAKANANSLNYKADLEAFKQETINGLASEFEGLYTSMTKGIQEAQQAQNDAKSAEEEAYYAKEYERLLAQRTSWQDMQGQLSNEIYRQVKNEQDKNQSKGIWATGRDAVLSNTVGKIWEFSLGSGNRVVPSLVDVPKRGVNFFGNLFDRDVQEEDGTRSNTKDKSVGDKWRYTKDQKVIQTSVKDKDTTGAWERATMWANPFNLNPISRKLTNKFLKGEDSKSMREKRKGTFDPEKTEGLQNFAENLGETILTDPASYIGAGAVSKFKTAYKTSKLGKFVGASVNAGKTSKLSTGFADSGVGKVVKWLGSPTTSPQTKLADAIATAKKTQGANQAQLIAQLRKVNQKLPKNQKLDISIFDDLKHISDDDAVILQRMVGNKLSARDRLRLAGQGNKATRDALEALARKWTEFTEEMKLADQITKTRFGSKKKLYVPRTAWLKRQGKSLDEYDFTLKQKTKRPATADEFRQGAIDRYFKSGVDEAFAKKGVKKNKAFAKEKAVASQKADKYQKDLDKSRKDIEDAYEATQTVGQKAKRVLSTPSRIWRRSVLTFRPAWYVNNEGFNVASSITEGGLGSQVNRFGAGRKIQKYIKDSDQLKKIDGDFSKFVGTKGVPGKFGRAIRKEHGTGDSFLTKSRKGFDVSKIGNAQERSSRRGLYITLREKGMTDEQAIKGVNSALANYGDLRNWERPLRAVMPFWQWQKFITKRVGTLPLKTPRGAKVWSTAYQEMYEKPLGALPDETQKIVDPHTGEVVDYNPRESKRGKLYNPLTKSWINTPFNGFTPDALTSVGINPLITAWNDYQTNRDKWGNRLDDRQWWENIAAQFPQFNVAKALVDGNRAPGGMLEGVFGTIKNKQKWLALGSGLPKEIQGFDPDASNYSKKLDPKQGVGDELKSFFGIPRSVQFDQDKFDANKRRSSLFDEWFKTDFSEDFDKRNAQQTAVAKKHGYTLDEVYGTAKKPGLFSKNDAPFTQGVKQQKREAKAIKTAFWDKYIGMVKEGDYAGASRFANTERIKREEDQTFIKNPELKDFLNTTSTETGRKLFFRGINKRDTASTKDDIDLTDARKYVEWLDFWGKYTSSSKEVRRTMLEAKPEYKKAYDAKDIATLQKQALARYRLTPKGKFWEKYHAIEDKDVKSKFYKNNYEERFGGKSSTDKKPESEASKFWKKFWESNPDQRFLLLKDNPQYKSDKPKPTTSEEYNKLREGVWAKKRETFKGNPKFDAFLKANRGKINVKAEQAFLRQKKISPVWKVR